jgi:hypothetical protein
VGVEGSERARRMAHAPRMEGENALLGNTQIVHQLQITFVQMQLRSPSEVGAAFNVSVEVIK